MQLVASALAVTAWPAAAFGEHRALAGNCGDLTWGLLLIVDCWTICRFPPLLCFCSAFRFPTGTECLTCAAATFYSTVHTVGPA